MVNHKRHNRVLVSVVAVGSIAALSAGSAAPLAGEHWVATWTHTLEGGGPVQTSGTAVSAMNVKNQTIRIPLKISIGGTRLRLRLSNEYGSKPLIIGAA